MTALNGLQTNASVLQELRKCRKAGTYTPKHSTQLGRMHQYLERIGLKVSCAAVLCVLVLSACYTFYQSIVCRRYTEIL